MFHTHVVLFHISMYWYLAIFVYEYVHIFHSDPYTVN